MSPRTANDVGEPKNQTWPPAGWCNATCVKAERWKSPKKNTPAVKLFWRTPDGEYEFDDCVFVTERAIQRLNLVALRVCAMPRNTVLPDDNRQAVSQIASYILENARGKQARVLIEQQDVDELDQYTGEMKKRRFRTVAFIGYEPMPESRPQAEDSAIKDALDGQYVAGMADDKDGDIPF